MSELNDIRKERLVFVYGTLKSMYHNSVILKDGNAKLLGNYVVKGYKLYNAGFPVAMVSENDSVYGELWDIGNEKEERTLADLDRLEGEGSMYHRTKVQAENKQTLPDNSTFVSKLPAEMYVGGKNWRFTEDRLCPKNKDGHYEWNRERY